MPFVGRWAVYNRSNTLWPSMFSIDGAIAGESWPSNSLSLSISFARFAGVEGERPARYVTDANFGADGAGVLFIHLNVRKTLGHHLSRWLSRGHMRWFRQFPELRRSECRTGVSAEQDDRDANHG